MSCYFLWRRSENHNSSNDKNDTNVAVNFGNPFNRCDDTFLFYDYTADGLIAFQCTELHTFSQDFS